MSINPMRIKRAIQSSLKLEIVVSMLGCLIASYFCFIAFNGVTKIIFSYLYREEIAIQKLVDLKDKFQTHVTQNNLSSTDYQAIDDWIHENSVVVLLLKRFDEHKSQSIVRNILIRRMPREENILKTEAIVHYADGDHDTLFLYLPWRSLKLVSWLVSSILSFGAWISLCVYILKKKVNYILKIQEGISILESGDLGHTIRVEGWDELSHLAQSINALSRSIRAKTVSEQKALQTNKEIIGDLSHDIRTPLTVGIGYLTLVLENAQLSKQEQRDYLMLVLKKMNQLKDRTCVLLEYATIYSGQQPLEKSVLAFGTLTDQLKAELEAWGEVSVRDELPKGIQICGDLKMLERLFDNILSNVQKYGAQPVEFCRYVKGGYACVEIANAVDSKAQADGKSLGLKICSAILESHEGFFETSESDDTYRALIAIPVSHTSCGTNGKP